MLTLSDETQRVYTDKGEQPPEAVSGHAMIDTGATIEPIVIKNVRQGSVVHTDEWWAYKNLSRRGYAHETVRHGEKEYVKGETHTNSIDGYWSQLKRSILSTHIHVSKKHLPKYLAEFDFRHNTRAMGDWMFRLIVELLEKQPA